MNCGVSRNWSVVNRAENPLIMSEENENQRPLETASAPSERRRRPRRRGPRRNYRSDYGNRAKTTMETTPEQRQANTVEEII